MPGYRTNLISVSSIKDNGHKVVHEKKNSYLYLKSEAKFPITKKENFFCQRPPQKYQFDNLSEGSKETELWHKRMSHLNYRHLKNSLPMDLKLHDEKCERCCLAKTTKTAVPKKLKQNGRLAPAYFSPEDKYFDQHWQTVKNETTVQNLVFEGFLQTSIPSLIFTFYEKGGYHDFSFKNFFSLYRKILLGSNPVHENFEYENVFCMRRGYHEIVAKLFLSHSTEKLRRRPLLCFKNNSCTEKFYAEEGASWFYR